MNKIFLFFILFLCVKSQIVFVSSVDSKNFINARVLGLSLDTGLSKILYHEEILNSQHTQLLQNEGWELRNTNSQKFNLAFLFSLVEFDRVIFITNDAIVLSNNLTNLVICPTDICLVENYEEVGTPNTGVISLIPSNSNRDLIKNRPDDWFSFIASDITWLSFSYNGQDEQFYRNRFTWDLNGPYKIIQFKLIKPWAWWSFPLFRLTKVWRDQFNLLDEPKLSTRNFNIILFFILYPIEIFILIFSIYYFKVVITPNGISPNNFVTSLLLFIVFTIIPFPVHTFFPFVGFPLLGWSVYIWWLISGYIIVFLPYFRWAFIQGVMMRKENKTMISSFKFLTLLVVVGILTIVALTFIIFFHLNLSKSLLGLKIILGFLIQFLFFFLIRHATIETVRLVFNLGARAGIRNKKN